MAHRSFILACLAAHANTFNAMRTGQVTKHTSSDSEHTSSDSEFTTAASSLFEAQVIAARESVMTFAWEGCTAAVNPKYGEDPACHPHDAVCCFLKRMEMAPTDIVILLVQIYDVISSTIDWINTNNPDNPDQKWTEIEAIGETKAWKVFETTTDDAWRNEAEYTNAKTAWESGWNGIAADLKTADTAAKAGDPKAWTPVLTKIVNAFHASLVAGNPKQTSVWNQIQTSLIGGIEAYEKAAEGKPAQAVGKVWNALYGLAVPVFGVVPDSDTDKRLKNINVLVEGVQTTIDNIDTKMLTPIGDQGAYKICRKKTSTRASQPVSKCFEGYRFDETALACFPNAANGADCEAAGCPLNADCPNYCPADKRYCCKKGATANGGPCEDAQYVDFDFALGLATDYYQCVSPIVDIATATSFLEDFETATPSLAQREATSASSALLQRASAQTMAQTRTLDSSTDGKGSTGAVSAVPKGGTQPVCDPNSLYTDAIPSQAGKCFERCPAKYEVIIKTSGSGSDVVQEVTDGCRQLCTGGLNVDRDANNDYLKFGIGLGDVAFKAEVCADSVSVVPGDTDTTAQLTSAFTVFWNVINSFVSNGEVTEQEVTDFSNQLQQLIDYFFKPFCGDVPGSA